LFKIAIQGVSFTMCTNYNAYNWCFMYNILGVYLAYMFLFFYFFFFWNRFLLCSLGWSWTPDFPASTSCYRDYRHELSHLSLLLLTSFHHYL
jgi:hypothetical protein